MTSTFSLDRILQQIGQAGKRMSEIGSAEAAAGNVSVCIRFLFDLKSLFPKSQPISLPLSVPELAGATVIVSGSGTRLRDLAEAPLANLGCIQIAADGQTGQLFTAASCQFERVTSEFNSHLAVHARQMRSSDVHIHTVLHCQPIHLTYLSHLSRYQDWRYLNTHLLRWQPETILHFPQGLGVLPFILPGSDEQMRATADAMQVHPILLWAQHGILARSANSVLKASDLIEYAETAAHYEYLNLVAGDKSEGLSPQQLRALCEHWNIQQTIF